MARVVFYEKPGCHNNTLQKQWLTDSGHEVIARNLLTEAWTAERLLPFLAARPVSEWFNPAAPAIKSGEVNPTQLSAQEALILLILQPLLIRRPLLQVDNEYRQGFDPEEVKTWIGLSVPSEDEGNTDIQTCHKTVPCAETKPL
ncbi:ArsC/Spx/MgsR family protein [Thioflexithrix psekupsensis]|uniref:Nitrogenase-associated protein n=1 Tax=Thioflexithrix psekupsensis TaxID=1570016 RepID=A0A251XA95_9GAMM|nr:ArsC/Spx/MgsR family protein [Thioflexithrix psekupsensis]OUD14442.1 hypothetical protein TPSD3_09040 [Thioflexithrix psekupsensis]